MIENTPPRSGELTAGEEGAGSQSPAMSPRKNQGESRLIKGWKPLEVLTDIAEIPGLIMPCIITYVVGIIVLTDR